MSEEVESGESAEVSTGIGHKAVCRVCGKEFKCISNSHLKMHGYTVAEYLKEFDLTMSDVVSDATKKLYVSTNRSRELYKGKTWEELHGAEGADALKKEFRKAACERYKSGILKVKISKPHRYLMDLLTAHDVVFEFEYPIADYLADIAILDAKVVIEVDGNYFHNAANLPYEELSPIQKQTADNDRNKNVAFRDCGWEVLRFWEMDICDTPTVVVNAILLRLGKSRVYPEPDVLDFGKCAYCGKPKPYKQLYNTYCSRECVYAAKKFTGIYEGTCQHCGKQFNKKRRSSPRKFCSKECEMAGRDRNTSTEYITKMRESSTNSEYNKKRREDGRVYFVCPCGKETWKPKCHVTGAMLYCCRDCRSKYRHEYVNKSNNPLYQEKECRSQ